MNRAIWYAMNSEDGSTLLDIAREHVALVREMNVWPADYGGQTAPVVLDDSRSIYLARIKQLQNKRDSIIQKYEGVEEDDRTKQKASSR